MPDGVARLHDLVRRHPAAWSAAGSTLERLRWQDDVEAVRAAFFDRFAGTVPPDATGVYLGIDGLQMSRGGGGGIEMGCSRAWHPGDQGVGFIYNCDQYCDPVPLPSLAAYYAWYYAGLNIPEDEVQAMWERGESLDDGRPAFDGLDVEFPICLGASALVVCHALRSVGSAVLSEARREMCIVLGFHDGDMLRLGRATSTGFVCDPAFIG